MLAERCGNSVGIIKPMELSFQEQLELTLIDKAVIGGLLALAGFVFSRSLEAFKTAQLRSLEGFKTTQSQELARFTQEQNRNLEEYKGVLATESESRRNVRLAVAEVAKRIAAATHSISWTTWAAKNSPDTFDNTYLDKYDREIHPRLNEIVGTRVALAALAPLVHDQLSPLIANFMGWTCKWVKPSSSLGKTANTGSRR
jgi:hypothetical protein